MVIMITGAEIPWNVERLSSENIFKCFFETLIIDILYTKGIKIITYK